MSDRKQRFARRAAEARAANGWDINQLKFDGNTGQYSIGWDANAKTITGAKVLADVASTTCGRRKFLDDAKRFVYAQVLADSDEVVLRADLGDTDETRWPVTKDGKGRLDPWRVAYCLPAYLADDSGVFDYDNPYMLVAEYDAIETVANLLDALAVRTDGKDGCLVTLGGYLPPGKKYHRPILRIESWVTVPEDARRLVPPPVPKPAPAPAQLPFSSF